MIHELNQSKNDYYGSEDSIKSGIINNYFITIIADGNGTVGLQSKKYHKDNLQYSEIALSTEQLVMGLYKYVTSILLIENITLNYLSTIVQEGLYKIANKINYQICCCLICVVINRSTSVLYSISIGDCDFTIFDISNINNIYQFYTKSQQTTIQLYQTSSNNYIQVPNVIICPPFSMGMIDQCQLQLPYQYCILVYSDGLSREAVIPEKDFKEGINKLAYISKLSLFNELRNEEKYLKSIISLDLLLSIIKNELKNGGKAIIDQLILNADENHKIDDRAVVFFSNYI